MAVVAEPIGLVTVMDQQSYAPVLESLTRALALLRFLCQPILGGSVSHG